MGGRSAAAAPTRYAGIQVQTSALGVQMPIVWGTARCKCNLVWYGDFKSKAQKASAGKGGGVTTGYNYSASLVLGLCEGPIADVTGVWVNSKYYKGGGGVALRKAGLSMSTGAVGQAVWGYLTSKHPDQAIGYSGLAIAYASNYPLDGGAGTPNHTFEVVSTVRLSALGLPDANPKDIVADFFTNSRYGLPGWTTGLLDTASLNDWGNYCLAANLVLSPALDQAQRGSDFLSEIFQAANSTCVWSEGVLKFVPYGDTQVTGNGVTWTPDLTPVYSLDSRNFIPHADGDDPVAVDLQDQADAYNMVQIEYLDRTNHYNSAIATAQDLANIGQYGRRKKGPTTLHSICTPAVARAVAQLHLQRTLHVRAQYKFDLDWSFALLEPGDIVEITDPDAGLNAYPVRITQIEDDEDTRRSITAEDLLAGVSHAPLYANQEGLGYVSEHSVDPGGVEANLLLWSEDFTQSVWSKDDVTIASNAATDPLFGTTTADLVIPDTVNAGHVLQQPISNPLSGVAYTLCAYVKPFTRKVVHLRLGDGTGNNAYIEADVSTGTILTQPVNSGTGAGAAGSVVSAGNGWYRVSITCVFTSPPAIYANVQINSDSNQSTWTGDGVHGVYVWGVQVKQGVDVPQYAYTGAAIAGPFLFNPPASLAGGPQSEACAAVAGGANWGGCYVWTSVDGTNYQNVGVIDQPARSGYITASLGAGADPDTAETLSVDLGASAGALMGGSSADADALTTLCLVDNELIAYSAATLSAPCRYDLTGYLRRGQMGTPAASHGAHAPFVRMDDGVFSFPYMASQAGQQIYVKFQSFNHWGAGLQDLSVCNAYLITLDPVGTGPGIAPGANRICFSEFEHGANDGWFTGYNSAGIAVARSSATYLGYVYNKLSAASAAVGQTVSQKSINFPVTGGERLAVMARCEMGAGWTGWAAIGFLDAGGATIAEPVAFTVPSGTAYASLRQAFVTAPAGAVAAWFEYYCQSTASGAALVQSLVQPMVCGANAEQTTFPSFVKGPAAEYGADVTGNWTAAAIVGQAPAATDTTIANGATKNTVTIGTAAPTGPTAGDLWNDTSVTPNAWKAYKAGAWIIVSTNGGAFDSNMYEAAGGSAATLTAFKTILGVASAVSGQGPWATTSTPLASVLTPTTNLLYNPTGALGEQGWTVANSTFGSVIQTAGEGPYFHNNSASNATGCGQYQDIPCYPSAQYSLSAWLAAYGVTGTGLVRVYVEWLTSAKAHISYSGVAQIGAGTGWTYSTIQNQTSPSNAAYARVWTDIWGSGTWANSNAAWKLLKLEGNSVSTPWSDETTNGALYRDGSTIDSLQPAQYAADVTGLNIAASITGQGALATLSQAAWATQVTGTGKPEDYATKSHVYRQTSAPSSPTTNDIWVKVDGSNNPLAVYAWNGSAWVLGADITSLNVASAISGQGSLATKNSVAGSDIDPTTVTTGNIVDNAIQKVTYAIAGSVSSVAGSGASYTLIALSVVKDVAGSVMRIDGTFTCTTNSGFHPDGCYLDLYRGSTFLSDSLTLVYSGLDGTGVDFCLDDGLAAGSYTYYLKIRGTAGSYNVSSSLLQVTEIKK